MTQIVPNTDFHLAKNSGIRSAAICLALACVAAPALIDAASLQIKGNSARLIYISGKVEVQRDGTRTWRSAYRNRHLGGGDKVRTQSRALAEIALPGGSILRVAPFTEVQLKPPTLGEEVVTTVKVSFGRFWSNIRRLTQRGRKFSVETDSAVIGVRGTIFNTVVDSKKGVNVQVYRGEVEVWNPFPEDDPDADKSVIESPTEMAPSFREVTREQWTVKVGQNQQIRVEPNGDFEEEELDPEAEAAAQSWIRFNRNRDELLANSRQKYFEGLSDLPEDGLSDDPEPDDELDDEESWDYPYDDEDEYEEDDDSSKDD